MEGGTDESWGGRGVGTPELVASSWGGFGCSAAPAGGI